MDRTVTRVSAEAVQMPEGEDFKALVRIRRNELLGLWAAARMGMTGYAATSYANEVVRFGLREPSDQSVVQTIADDFRSAGYDFSKREIWNDLEHYASIATLELGGEPRPRPKAA